MAFYIQIVNFTVTQQCYTTIPPLYQGLVKAHNLKVVGYIALRTTVGFHDMHSYLFKQTGPVVFSCIICQYFTNKNGLRTELQIQATLWLSTSSDCNPSGCLLTYSEETTWGPQPVLVQSLSVNIKVENVFSLQLNYWNLFDMKRFWQEITNGCSRSNYQALLF